MRFKFFIDETSDMGYSPYNILLDETQTMNELADKIQKAKGNLPLFDDSGDYDPDDWYNFYLECDEDGVKCMYFEYGISSEYCDEIELTEEEKQEAFEQVIKFFGSKDEYRKYIENYE